MQEHYYSSKQDSEQRFSNFSAVLRGFNLEFKTVSGVFSLKRIDRGTQVLAKYMLIKKGTMLDLGCGYGAIGIVYAKSCPECRVYMVDINPRAVAMAKYNAKKNKISNYKVLQSDVFSEIKDIMFDSILLNPPQTAGRDICIRMIKEAYEHMNKNGIFQMVARHNKGGKTLMECVNDTFKNVDVLAKSGGYWVYKAVKK
ncbi:MAG: methyltransferase [Candidatus Nanoarchaeia archaeon]|nr:methyltransferase [Candidatus Nanoarchaeia archaeon]